jgi:hypothetical protein
MKDMKNLSNLITIKEQVIVEKKEVIRNFRGSMDGEIISLRKALQEL